ncbi:MAG: hypothetical protein ACYC96_01050 [Fimbriimonadaceae bacterium]
MTNQPNKLRRRDFLASAATAFGSGMLGVLPTLSAAQSVGLPKPIAKGPSLYYWNGARFIAPERVHPGVEGVQTVTVQIHGFGSSPSVATIDVQMPGGVFAAFTAQPRGQKVVRFSAPIRTQLGLTLIVGGAGSRSTFALRATAEAGPKLAVGTYLLLDSAVPASDFALSATGSQLIYVDGQPVALPYTLIGITV